MASLMENLIEVLNAESQEYKSLLGLSSQKTPVIVAGDLNELAIITDEEQAVVSKIENLEKRRNDVFADIANVINKDVNTLKLSDLILMLAKRPDEQQKLAKAHDELKTIVREVKRVNEQNRDLINNAMEMVEFNLNLIQAAQTAPETANYNRGAYNTGDQMGIDRSGFDAKQ